MAFAPNRKPLASVGIDGSLRLWSVRARRSRRPVRSRGPDHDCRLHTRRPVAHLRLPRQNGEAAANPELCGDRGGRARSVAASPETPTQSPSGWALSRAHHSGVWHLQSCLPRPLAPPEPSAIDASILVRSIRKTRDENVQTPVRRSQEPPRQRIKFRQLFTAIPAVRKEGVRVDKCFRKHIEPSQVLGACESKRQNYEHRRPFFEESRPLSCCAAPCGYPLPAWRRTTRRRERIQASCHPRQTPTAHRIPNRRPHGGSGWSTIPLGQNPAVDDTGQYVALGQSSWPRLVSGGHPPGLLGPDDAITRTCNIPVGRALFFPVWNVIWCTVPGVDCPEEQDPLEWFLDNEDWTARPGPRDAAWRGGPTRYR